MEIILFLILGLVAGAIAKLILPGRQGGGWLITLVLGVVGALLGALIGGLINRSPNLFDLGSIWTWVLAIVGAILVLLIYGAVTKNRSHA